MCLPSVFKIVVQNQSHMSLLLNIKRDYSNTHIPLQDRADKSQFQQFILATSNNRLCVSLVASIRVWRKMEVMPFIYMYIFS